jgi:hypothetical protein
LPVVPTIPPRSNTLFGGITVWNSRYSLVVGTVAEAEIDRFTATGNPVMFVSDTLKTLGVAATV